MLYSWRLVLSTLSFSCLLGSSVLVSAGRIPTRKVAAAGHDVDSAVVDMSTLSMFKQYVCPKNTDLVSRQSTTITVPKSQLRNILIQIYLVELQLLNLITLNDDNPDFAPLPTVVTQVISSSITRTIPLASLSSAVESVLIPMTSTVSPNSATASAASTRTVTRTTTATTVTTTETLGSDSTQNVAAPSTTTAQVPDSAETTTVADSDTTTSFPESSSTSLDASLTTDTPSTTEPSETDSASTSTLPGGGFVQTSMTISPVPTSPATGYNFDPLSRSNVAVYFGQTALTGTTSLEAQCADSSVDIVLLAFVISQLNGGIYPTVNFGAACGGQTPEMAAQAPGLLSCPELAGNISTCQNTYGKKVLLSVGGAISQISFTGEDQARNFGDVLWNLFGPAGNVDVGLRPFGDVVVDGFDIGESWFLFRGIELFLKRRSLRFSPKSWIRGGGLYLRISSPALFPAFPGVGRLSAKMRMCLTFASRAGALLNARQEQMPGSVQLDSAQVAPVELKRWSVTAVAVSTSRLSTRQAGENHST